MTDLKRSRNVFYSHTVRTERPRYCRCRRIDRKHRGRRADDDAYLAQIHKIGLTGDKDGLIQLGHLICADRSAGETPDQLAQVVQSKNPGISLSDATGVVSAAESNYCP